MRLARNLRGRRGVVIDTMCFAYLFEDSPVYGDVCQMIVEQVENAVFSGVVTPVTAAELLVKPLSLGRADIADCYRSALQSMRNIEAMSMTFEVGCMAGALRAKYRLPLPDMIQAAFAMQSERPTIITNDKDLSRVAEVEVFLLDKIV